MTIGKKLYIGFGTILGILSLLFLVNIITGVKQTSARKDAKAALDSFTSMEDVRYAIGVNSLNLNNFLLSGDPRDEEKVNKGMADLSDLMKRGQGQSSNEKVRSTFIQLDSTVISWNDNFAKP